MLPLNLLTPGSFAEARAAYDEACFLGGARIAADTREPDGTYKRVPRPAELALDPAALYVHLCSNNTIYGTQWHDYPATGDVPLVADMTLDDVDALVDLIAGFDK
jgi:phosphoserine aminotransferase